MDFRGTVRLWAKRGAAIPKFAVKVSPRQPARLAILWDVSGSMEDYVELYLPWIYQLVHRLPRVGVFPFAAELVDATGGMRGSYALARARLGRLEGVFSGGTRIGDALREWMDRYGAKWIGGGRLTLLIISDGWDAGDPDVLASVLRRLYSQNAVIVWMNPLMATPGFSPSTRALRAAKPFVHQMISGHSPQALLKLTT